MKIEFYGAASCVTGSCHLINVLGKKILLDCGMFQGKDEKERGNDGFPFNPKDIDYLILSHAHIDHSGRIPLLYKQGFVGDIICTEATLDLCNYMLQDSGYIQEKEVEWKNRKRERQGLPNLEPLYKVEDAVASLRLFRGYPYGSWINLFKGFKIRFNDAGHLLGSAITEILIEENGKEKKLVYTGDLGNINIPIINDPTTIDKTDYLIMETTYGNRLHISSDGDLRELYEIIQKTFKRGGNVIIPSFAVGRTQEVIYALNKYVEKNELKNIRVYVDSPLATEATEIFKRHKDVFDKDAREIIEKGDDPLNFKGLFFTKSAQESADLNKITGGIVIISASGMCDAGRIKHHLKHNLWRKESSIVFVGYQAEGTLGRRLVEGEKNVKVLGEEIVVNAEIHQLHGLSGHADKTGLLNWLDSFKTKPLDVLLVHGDKDASTAFKEAITSKGYKARVMGNGEIFDTDSLISNIIIESKKDKLYRLIDNIENIESIGNEELINKIKELL